MAKIAQSTCTVCHVIKPRTEMQQKTKSEYSGNSIGMNNKGTTSGRLYNRQRKYWICNACAKNESSNSGVWAWLLIGAVGWMIYAIVNS
jgi:hypothetical protein